MDTALAALGVTPQTAPPPVASSPAPSGGGMSPDLSALGVTSTGGPAPAVAPAKPASAGSGGPVPTFFPATENPSDSVVGAGAKAGLRTLGNLAPSLANFGIGAVEAPFKGVSALTQIPGAVAGLVKDAGSIVPAAKSFASAIPSTLESFFPLVAGAGEAAIAALAHPIASFTGGSNPMLDKGLKMASESVQNDPVGQVGPLVLLGRQAAHSVSPEAGVAFDEGISKVASPVMAAGRVAGSVLGSGAGLASSFVKWGTGQATGLDPSTIEEVIKNPENYSAAKIAETTRTGVASSIKDAIDTRESQLGESGQAYAPIRKMPLTIDVSSDHMGISDTFDALIEKNTGLKIGEDGNLTSTATSKVDAPTDVAKVQRFYNAWKPYFEQGMMTPGEFLTMRGKLATIADYEGIGKSSPLESAAAGLRSDINTAYRPQVPGLEDIDAQYSSQASDLKTLSAGLFDRDGNLRDSDINKIANATGKSRSVLLGQLEQISPGITQKINALKAVEDISRTEGQKVGTYARILGPAGAMGGIFTGNIPLIIGGITEAVLTSPSVAIPLLRAYGFSKALTAGVTANLAAIAKGINNIPNAPTLSPTPSPVSVPKLTVKQ